MADIMCRELKKVLENISGRQLEGNYTTTAEMLHAFNDMYKDEQQEIEEKQAKE